MIAKNHMAFASAAILSVESVLNYSSNFTILEIGLFYIFVILGSILPDIDESDSYIGRKLPIVSTITGSALKHKTFTHYLFVPIIIFCIGYFTVEDHFSSIIIIALAIGILLHDIGDMFTMNGIKAFLFPFFMNTNIVLAPSLLRFKTNGAVEYLIYYFIMLPLNAALFLYLGFY